MGRHSKNKGNWGVIAGTDKQLATYYIELPYPFIVNVRPDYTENAVACGIYDSTPMIINDLYSKKEEIVESMKAYGYYVKDTRPMKLLLTDLCPQCEESGIPRISLRNRNDYRNRTNKQGIPTVSFRESLENQSPLTRNSEYWLCYWHGKGKTHWIQEYQGSNEGTFKSNKKKEIDPRKFLMGQVMRIKMSK